jgi:hypothetical protein
MALTSQNQTITALIEKTDYTFDSGIDSTTPADGLTVIGEWLTALRENGITATDPIMDTLEDLQIALTRPSYAENIPKTLQTLIDQTQTVMNMPEASAEQTELSQLLATLNGLLLAVNKQ